MNRIGIIGSGIAGLTFAWLARQSGYHVTLFDSQPRLGMDAHSIDLDLAIEQAGDARIRVDVPPRMFNREDWPLLTRLYKTLGVESQIVDTSKSFTVGEESSWLRLGDRYRGGFSAVQLVSSRVRSVASETARLQTAVTTDSLAEMPPQLSLGDYLARENYRDDFVYDFLLPALASTVLTCTYDSLSRYPAKVALLSLLNQVDRSPLRRTTHGTADVVDRLSAMIDDVRLSTPVTSICEAEDHVSVLHAGGEDRFDRLVIATQANSAAKLLGDNGKMQPLRETLENFEYENVQVVVHQDDSFMPEKASHRACFNFNSKQDRTDAMCTIWLNRFYPEWPLAGNLYQTIRPARMPAEDKLIASTAMQRPIVSPESLVAVNKLEQQRSVQQRLGFIGSYAAATVPLLESGVASAFDLARGLGMKIPSEPIMTSAG